MASIETLCCALVLACFATSLSSAYQCHQFLPGDTSTTTCEATVLGCLISKTSSDISGDIIQKKCATEAEPCHITAASSQDIKFVTYCCTEDLCNDDFPAIEGSTNQCYVAQCTGEGCLTDAINNGPVTVCPRTEFGCNVVTQDTEQEITMIASCPETACTAGTVEVSPGTTYSVSCCNSDFCNNGDSPSQNDDVCYQITCFEDNCVENAVTANTTGFCPRTANGCSFSSTITTDDNGTKSYIQAAACAPSVCEESAVQLPTLTVVNKCCNTSHCNNVDLDTDSPSQNDDVCYQNTCFEDNCVKNAVTANTTGFCPRTANGCTFSSTTTTNDNGTKSYIQAATCAPSVCANASVQLTKLTVVNTCCSTSRCNSGDMITDQPPSGGQCYSAVCDGKDCLDKAIKDNTSATCTMDPAYGCATFTTLGDDPTTIATCVPESAPCTALEIAEFESRIVCCKTDKCNTEAYFTSGSTTIHLPNPLVMFMSSILMILCLMPYKRTE